MICPFRENWKKAHVRAWVSNIRLREPIQATGRFWKMLGSTKILNFKIYENKVKPLIHINKLSKVIDIQLHDSNKKWDFSIYRY